MLNVMARRMRGQNLNIAGVTTFNGASLSTVRYAYVMQQDVLLPTLTVRETLRYSAELRLSSATTKAEREKIMEEVILQLGLKECADTLIGDGAHKGCSGGEKRRVSIGVQLLSNPSVLFLDGMFMSETVNRVRRLTDDRTYDWTGCDFGFPTCPDPQEFGTEWEDYHYDSSPAEI